MSPLTYVAHSRKGYRGDPEGHRLAAMGQKVPWAKGRSSVRDTDFQTAKFLSTTPAEEPEARMVPGITPPLGEQQAQPVEGGQTPVTGESAPTELKEEITQEQAKAEKPSDIEIKPETFSELDTSPIPGTPPPPRPFDEEAPGAPEGGII